MKRLITPFLLLIAFACAAQTQTGAIQKADSMALATKTPVNTTFVTDKLGDVEIIVSRKFGHGVKTRKATLMRRVMVQEMADGQKVGTEVERYIETRKRHKRITAKVWALNAAQ